MITNQLVILLQALPGQEVYIRVIVDGEVKRVPVMGVEFAKVYADSDERPRESVCIVPVSVIR